MSTRPIWKLENDADGIGMDFGAGTLNIRDSLVGARLPVPVEARVRDGRLEWRRGDPWAIGEPVDGCLLEFARLASVQDDSKIAQFALHYGVLGIDSDGRPGTERGNLPPHPEPLDQFGPIYEGEWAFWHSEPLERWREYARAAQGILGVVVALRMGDEPRMKDWLAAQHLPDDVVDPTTWTGQVRPFNSDIPQWIRPDSEERQRQLIAQFVTLDWLRPASIFPRLMWSEQDRPRLTLELSGPLMRTEKSFGFRWPSHTLFASLAAQLVAVITSEVSIARCSICGHFFVSDRMVRHDRRALCSDECRNEAARIRKRESARKRRQREKETSHGQ